jgi:hypothetical protein
MFIKTVNFIFFKYKLWELYYKNYVVQQLLNDENDSQENELSKERIMNTAMFVIADSYCY